MKFQRAIGKRMAVIALSLCMIVASISVAFLISAETSNVIIKDNAQSGKQFSESLIYNVAPISADIIDNGNVESILSNPFCKKITDGIENGNLDCVSGSKGLFKKSDGTLRNQNTLEVYDDFVWMLDSADVSADIDEVYIKHCGIGDLNTYKYAVYLAENKDELGKDSSKVAEYTNTAAADSQLISFPNPVKAKYMLIRVLMGIKPTATWGVESCHARINEVAVFGTRGVPAISVLDNTDPAYTLKNSLIYGSKPIIADIYDDGAASSILGNPNCGKLTDGACSDNLDIVSGTAGIFKDKDGKLRENTVHDDLIWQIDPVGSVCEIRELFISHCNDGGLATYKYQIYAADDLDNISAEESLVLEYTNITAAYKQLIKFNTPIHAKYIMLRITMGVQPTATWSWESCYARVNEFAVFGARGVADVEVTDNGTASKPLTESAIYKANPYSIYIYDNGENYDLTPNPTKDRLTDGKDDGMDFTWDGVIGCFKNKDGTLRNQKETEVYTDVVYQIGLDSKPAKLNEVYLQFAGDSLSTYHYQVFAANTVSELGKESSLIADIVNSSASARQTLKFNKEVKGSYLMLRVLMGIQPSATWDYNLCYTRFQEMAAFVESDSDITFEAIDNTVNNDYFKKFGKSLLSGITPNVKYCGTSTSTSFDTLTDGDYLTHLDYGTYITEWLNPSGEYVDVIYRLGEEPYQMNSLIYSGAPKASEAYFTGRYQVYMAMDQEDLFLPENCVYEYNYRVSGVSAIQHITWKKNNPVGCFVAIRFLESVNKTVDYSYLRTAEFAIFGEKAVIEVTPVNLAENMPVEAYRVSSKGNMTELTEKEFGARMIADMTDGSTESYASINADNKRLELLYNLCQNGRVYGYSLKPYDKSYMKGLKIYASDDLNKVWEESALVYENKTENETGTEFEKPITARYIRFSVPANNGKYIDVAEIVINGMSDQLFKKRNIMPYVDVDDDYIFECNYSSHDINHLTFDKEEVQRLFDNDKSTVPNIYGAKAGASGLNYFVSLGDLRNISRINISFNTEIPEWLPVKAKVYIGETTDEVIGKNRKAAKEFNGVPGEDGYDMSFNPTLARYICISIEKMSDDYFVDDTITPSLTEISVYATNVRGMNTSAESDALYTFNDAETGIKWEVVRRDLNDIYTKIYSSKLIKTAVTAQQKKNVAKDGYKVMSGTVNEIAFYDVTGKRITDIGERTVRVLYPNTAGVDPFSTLIYTVNCNSASGSNTYISPNEKYMCADYTDLLDIKSVIAMFTGETISDDPVIPDITPDNSGNDNNSDGVSIDETENDNTQTPGGTKKVVKKLIKKKKNTDSSSDYTWLYIVIPVGVLLVAAGTATTVVLLKKKKRSK